MRYGVSVGFSLFRFLQPTRAKHLFVFLVVSFLASGLWVFPNPALAKKPKTTTASPTMKEKQRQGFLARIDSKNRLAQKLHYEGKEPQAEQILVTNLRLLEQKNALGEKVAIQAYFLLGKVYAMQGEKKRSTQAFYAALQKHSTLTPDETRDAPQVVEAWREANKLVNPAPVQPPTPANVEPVEPPTVTPPPEEPPTVAAAPTLPPTRPMPVVPPQTPPLPPPPLPTQWHRFFLHVGAGGGGRLVSQGTSLDTLWGFTTKTGLYQPGSIAKTGFANAGLILQAELGVRLNKQWALGVVGALQTYLDNNVSSQDWTMPSVCTDGQGQPIPCYPTSAKERFGFRVLGKLRYHIPVASRWIQPYVFGALGGGRWRGTVTVDVARENNAGRPIFTDRCSAISQGTATPEECRSADGKPGFNAAAQTMMPFDNARLNRVCPVGQACLDTVGSTGFMVGAGGGFYVGTPRIGGFVEVTALALIGSSSGMTLDATMGPQLSF